MLEMQVFEGQLSEHTWLSLLFYSVFLSQVLVISFFLPRKLLNLMSDLVDTYPPSEYPKLYPTSIEAVNKSRRAYWTMNLAALLLGLGLFLTGVLSPTKEMLNWDSSMVLTIYMLIQYSPLTVGMTSGSFYLNLKRRNDSRTLRKAELHRRRLFDFVSPFLVGTGVSVYVAFVLLVLYIRQYEFPWFGGYWNIFGVTASNLLFSGVAVKVILGKKKDPYQAHEDRIRQMALTTRFLVLTSIAITLFLALTIILAALEMRHFQPISFSLYCQLLAALSFPTFRMDNVNFEVYKTDPLAT